MLRSIAINVAMVVLLALFVLSNIKAYDTTGNIGYVLVAINMGLYVGLYAIRERAEASSSSPLDWGVAFSAAFIGTLLRPATPLNIGIGDTLIGIGIATNIVSVLFLNRSLSLVPGIRTIKMAGPYRLLRHPMYSSEIVVMIGYLLVNLSVINTAIVLSNIVLMLVRIDREELFLSRNAGYRAYATKTRWKLLPFVY